MALKVSGIILVELPTTHGITNKGKQWEKVEYVLEISDKYHTKMKFSVYSWDGHILNRLKVGDKVEVSFTVEAREVKGVWWNDVKAYCIEQLM